ncbi:FkbM family methyltransferase [Micromonospora sp. STR1s_5]|nr:FkbM family methyltransferase [Micromonospora sp. STR1s_5]
MTQNPRNLGSTLKRATRWFEIPDRLSEALHLLRSINDSLRQPPAVSSPPGVENKTGAVVALGSVPDEIYAGYSAEDLWVFDRFQHAKPQPAQGFVTDFIGTRTRTTSLWDVARVFDGTVMPRPVPHDLFEAIEWVGLLKAVLSARDGRFTMMELGAGWGPWLAAGAVAARLQDLRNVRLLGVEADPGRFALMERHLRDNAINPAEHRLVKAAVGVEAGHARWPRIMDPANAGGARPVREEGASLDADDAAYMSGALHEYVEVEIVPLARLLAQEPIWDLVHVDVQGWEAKLCAGCIEPLNSQARWLVIGTHSRVLDGQVIETLHKAGWVLENEKPTRFKFDPEKPSLDSMAEIDGAQVWRNPRLADALRPA